MFLGVLSLSRPTVCKHVVKFADNGASRRQIARNILGGQPQSLEGCHRVSVWSQCTDGVANFNILFLRGRGAPFKTHRKWRELVETVLAPCWHEKNTNGKYLYDDPRGVGWPPLHPCSGLLRREGACVCAMTPHTSSVGALRRRHKKKKSV